MKTARYETTGGALAALLATRSFVFADLYTITLAGGGTVRIAAGDTDWTYGGNTWLHGKPPIVHPERRPTAHWKIGLDVDTWQFSVMPRPVDPLTGTANPDTINGLRWLASARAGILDGAVVQVDRAYLPSWPAFPRAAAIAPIGVVNVFTGRVAAIDVDRTSIIITLNSHLELLDQPMPRNLYQAGCGRTLFDAGCGLVAATYASSLVVNAGSTAGMLIATSGLPSGSGTYALGRVLFTSGANAGFGRSIRSMTQVTTTLQLGLIAPLPFAVAPGDTFTAWPGCNRTMATCTTWGNIANYGGQPYIPSPETAV